MHTISFHDTHVYPGCLATIPGKVTTDGTSVTALAEFSDGATASAELERLSQDEVFIRIDAYTTARRTHIPEKAWRLRYDKVPDIWNVIAKI